VRPWRPSLLLAWYLSITFYYQGFGCEALWQPVALRRPSSPNFALTAF
jgi:hypothetical protein